MQNPTLKQLIAQPNSLPDDPDFSKLITQYYWMNFLLTVPRVLLRSKLIPEIEEEEEKMKGMAVHGERADINILDNTAIMNQLTNLEVS